jgi:NADPH:quinone reductase-like Zn-dependent oxidoreductase
LPAPDVGVDPGSVAVEVLRGCGGEPSHSGDRAARAAMKAIVQDRYGGPEVLELRDLSTPVVGEGDVLLRVQAAGVDQGVWHVMAGLPYLVRVMGVGLRAPKQRVRGMDVAGRVEAVGADVTEPHPGDQVFGTCEGAFAEYALARADKVLAEPENLTPEQAAAVPISGCTALQGLRDKGNVRAGQRVLIIGAGGGVGTFAVQLAKAFGAEVTGVCSTAKVDLVRSIGADHTVDYTQEDFADSGHRYDLILDTAGNRSLSQLRRALTPRGTLVIVGGERGGRWSGGFERQIVRAPILSLFVSQQLRSLTSTARREDLLALKELIEAGKVAPVIDRTFPLREVPEAIRYMRAGHARGKIVVTCQPARAGIGKRADDVDPEPR